jgi:hypothetical protein
MGGYRVDIALEISMGSLWFGSIFEENSPPSGI